MPIRYLLVCGTFLISVLLYVDRACISAAAGPISTEFGLSDTQFGLALSAFSLGYALLQAPSGWLADRFGPRLLITGVVAGWSLLTGATGWTIGLWSLVVVRFLFGAAEAGAFPGMSRAVYSWIPVKERGLVQGINFAGSRFGAAVAFFVIAWMIEQYGWRNTFQIWMVIGLVFAVVWFLLFRDDPASHRGVGEAERAYIEAGRQRPPTATGRLAPGAMWRSKEMWLMCAQYFCSNFTFFFGLSWMYPYLKRTYDLNPSEAGLLLMAPFIGGFFGSLTAGAMIDALYRRGWRRWSRALPASIGFLLAAAGMLGLSSADTAQESVAWLTLAIFGADMTLAPSWTFCVDIGHRHAGLVSGTMNMAGNIGAFVTSLAFPYLKEWTGSTLPFFYLAAAMNALAIVLWTQADPEKTLPEE
ncbi:putative sulfoacetate transporter SauU [Pirellulimonas nuda]|uniref:Putative sulfoacetate transporter SauU n=1 Tax=Pirellulimonas nuda TaxID=2528009 RepID=A0A518DIT1_9BACT|nr:MFS transporter [Pirellulimonas nuda]QDU91385.1 putative sulfoacetate transporter SauU [Pirellulimonas nuda]